MDFNSAMQRAQSAAAGILGPENTAPTENPGILSTVLQILSQGLTAALSRNPGETLAGFQQQAAQQKQQQAAIQRQEKERREALTAEIFRGEVAAERGEETERRREARQTEREFQQFQQRQRELLGEQSFRANEAELTRMWQAKRDAEIERREDEKQQRQFDQQVKIQKGKLRKEFLDQGAGNYADELADYSLGVIDELSPGAAKANQTIQAKIARLQGLAARGAGSGGGAGSSAGRGSMQTFAELSDGSIIPAKDVKEGLLPPNVTVKRLFVPALQQPQQPATEGQLIEGINAARAAGKSEFQIRSALRKDGIPDNRIDLLMRPAYGPYVDQPKGGGVLAPPKVPQSRMIRGVPVSQ
jgi:hypothetical protein